MKKYNRPFVEIISADTIHVICDSDPLSKYETKGDGQMGNSGHFDEEEVIPTTGSSLWND